MFFKYFLYVTFSDTNSLQIFLQKMNLGNCENRNLNLFCNGFQYLPIQAKLIQTYFARHSKKSLC